MLKRVVWVLAGISGLAVAAPDLASAAGRDNGSTRRAEIPLTQDNNDALSAFVTSPAFGRVAAEVPSAVTAGPLFPLRGGLLCQRMTQTIDIDGKSVHASALMCRHPNGVWRIAVPPGARQETALGGPVPASGTPRPDDKNAAVTRRASEPGGSPIAKVD